MNKQIKISPSSLNVYIRDPAAWVMRTFFKEYGESNIYAIRGILVEHCVNMMLDSKGRTTFNDFAFSAILETMNQGIEFDMKQLKSFYTWGEKCYLLLSFKNKIVNKQTYVKGIIENVEMHGYLDYEYPNFFIDLKSVNTGKIPKLVSRGDRKGLLPAIKAENVRQQVIYSLLTNKQQSLLFVDENINETGQWLLYKVSDRDIKEHLPIIKKSLKEIKRLLTLKIEDVIIEVRPDKNKMNNKWSFDWDDRLREKAKHIWSLNE